MHETSRSELDEGPEILHASQVTGPPRSACRMEFGFFSPFRMTI